MIKRLLATTLAGAALAAAGLSVATPAHAGPEDGQGCVGTPTMPVAYVCVISVNPGAAVPNVTTTPLPVTVPPVCYFVGCTSATTVNVPVPNVTPGGGGSVIVLWHNGTYYPIGVSVDGVVTMIVDTVNTLVDSAEYWADVVLRLAGGLGEDVQRVYDDYVRPLVETPPCAAINRVLNRFGMQLVCDMYS